MGRQTNNWMIKNYKVLTLRTTMPVKHNCLKQENKPSAFTHWGQHQHTLLHLGQSKPCDTQHLSLKNKNTKTMWTQNTFILHNSDAVVSPFYFQLTPSAKIMSPVFYIHKALIKNNTDAFFQFSGSILKDPWRFSFSLQTSKKTKYLMTITALYCPTLD